METGCILIILCSSASCVNNFKISQLNSAKLSNDHIILFMVKSFLLTGSCFGPANDTRSCLAALHHVARERYNHPKSTK